jgi:hypothetical protein
MRRIAITIVAVLGYFHAGGAAPAATVVTQAPCVDAPNPWCLSFGPGGTIPVIRSIRLNADAAGKAIVTFHGSVACLNSPTGLKGEVELVSQIVTNAAANPDPAQPGGLLHTGTLPPDGRVTFSLASTRVFNVPGAGAFTYRFKLRRLGLSPASAVCRVYNAVFTIEFMP